MLTQLLHNGRFSQLVHYKKQPDNANTDLEGAIILAEIVEKEVITNVEGGWESKASSARRGYGIFFLILLIILTVIIVYYCMMRKKQNQNISSIKKL